MYTIKATATRKLRINKFNFKLKLWLLIVQWALDVAIVQYF